MAIDDLYGKILAMGAQTIRNHTVLPQLVNNVSMGSPTDKKPQGGTVEVLIPPEFATRDVVPASTPPVSDAPPSPTVVPVTLDYWKEVNFPLTEKHINLIENADGTVPMFIAQAAATLGDEISETIAAQYTGIYGFVGTPGETPFGSDTSVAQAARTMLVKQQCPKVMRQLVLDPDAFGNATGLSAFANAQASGTTLTIAEGEIGRKLGFYWHEDMAIARHTTGAAGSVLVDQGTGASLGQTTAHFDGFTTKASVGDVFTVAGDSQTYVVTACTDLVGTDADVSFQPAAKEAWDDNAAVTFKASHQVNLAFNPYAFAFSSRPAAQLNIPELNQGKLLATWVDEQTGLVLKLELKDEYHQTGFYMSCLWGTKLVLPKFAARVAG